jgi:Ca2+-binding RTX toxin-like protein
MSRRSLFGSLFGDDFDHTDTSYDIVEPVALRRAPTTDDNRPDLPTGDEPDDSDTPPPPPGDDTGSGGSTGGTTSGPGTGDTTGGTTGTNSGTHGNTDGMNVIGTDGDDNMLGGYYDDTMYGRGGNDKIEAGNGADKLYGEGGNDTLEGGSGDDVLDGGTGNDTLRGGLGADTLIGGEGMDNASYVLATSGVMVDLATGGITGEAAGDTYSGIENLFGSSWGDILNGDWQANVIHGGSGDDFVFGQAGDDRLFGDVGMDIIRGGQGNDIINGGLGNDRLTGDDAGQFGADTFVLRAGEGIDMITDFQHGVDKLDLRGYGITNFGSDGVLAVGATWGDLVWNADGGDKLVFDPYEHKLYQVTLDYSYDDYAWYVSDRQEIAYLQGVDQLSASDVLLG